MMKFFAGAPRPVMDTARLSAANALVQRTLAQHGLMPAADTAGTQPAPMTRGFDVAALLQQVLPGGAGGVATRDSPANAAQPEGAEFRTDSFTSSAGTRACRTYVPASAADGVRGIIVMLHGCTQTAEDFARGTDMNRHAEAERLVILYPQQSRGDNAQSCWNWFSRGDQRRDRGEPAIIAGMTRRAMEEFDVPAGRTFVAGLSAGAAMAVILGETYGDVFGAVGAHSGLPYGVATDVTSAFAAMAGRAGASDGAARRAPRTILFHGTADQTVQPANSEAIARQVMDNAGRETLVSDSAGTARGRGYTKRVAAAPGAATVLEHWSIDGLGHAWSGGHAAGSYTDAKGPDASAEMVRFFLQSDAERT